PPVEHPRLLAHLVVPDVVLPVSLLVRAADRRGDLLVDAARPEAARNGAVYREILGGLVRERRLRVHAAVRLREAVERHPRIPRIGREARGLLVRAAVVLVVPEARGELQLVGERPGALAERGIRLDVIGIV